MTDDTASVQTLLNKGHTAVWDQDWRSAVESYQSVITESPGHRQGLTGLGLAHFQNKEFEPALKCFQQLAKLDPEDPMPYIRIGQIYERVGMLHDAVLCYNQAAELNLKARDTDRTIENYNDSIRLDPENQAARSRLAVIYDKLDRKDEAVTEFLALAALFQSKGDQGKAAQAAQYAAQIHPASSDAREALVMIKKDQLIPLPERKKGGTGPVRMAQVRQLESSSADQQRSAAHDPVTEARLTALKELAGLLFESPGTENNTESPKKRPGRTITMVTGMLSSRQEDQARSLLHLSQFIDYQTSGREEKALNELERAIDLGLQKSASNYFYGSMIRSKDSQKSLGLMQKAVRNPTYALAAYLVIAEIYEKTGQLKEASTNYLQALKLADVTSVPEDQADELMQLYDPIFESNLHLTQEKDLRNLCATINGQLSRPDWREHLKSAREQLPLQPAGSLPIPLAEMLVESTSSQVVDSLADIRKLVAGGKFRAGMEEAFYALSLAPTYLPLHIQIGEILIAEGRVQEAVEKFLQVSRLYKIRGETPQAIRLLSRVSKLAPMDILLRTELLDLLKSIGRVDDAIQQYMDLANIHYLLIDLERAKESYQAALTLSRQSSTAREWSVKILHKFADIELQKFDWKGAVRVYEQLRSLQPHDPAPRESLYNLYVRIGMPAAAMNELDGYLKLLEADNLHSQIEPFLDKLLREYPDNIELQKRVVGYFVSIDQLPRVIEKLDALAERLMQEQNLRGALTTIHQIIALNPPNRSSYETLASEIKNKTI